MGTITQRKRTDGTPSFTAQIRIVRGGKLVHGESKTFNRRPPAATWLKNREAELAEPGALEKVKQDDPTLATVIGQYIKESLRDFGRTKTQVLDTIAASDLGGMRCSEIDSPAIIKYAQSIGAQPQTVANYLSHLAAVFTVARPAWGYPLDKQAIDDARTVGQKMGITGRSNQRNRRPTLDELDQILSHFAIYESKNPGKALPMRDLILFAIFSTRRQEEITTLRWADLNEAKSTIIVRDMKHPGEKIGNDVRVDLPPEALAIIQRQPRGGAAIFPVNGKTLGSYFTKACNLLEINDLHFHDLRHDGVSRLFEMGKTIPQAASVSGHRTWTSLKRYSHLDQAGDKYAGWKWLEHTGAK